MKIPPNKQLEPSESHRIKIEKVIKKLRTLFKISFNVFGSIAKDTYIGNHKELDLFFEGPSLEQTLEILSKDLKEPSFSRVKEKRAGHPYYTVIFKYLGVNWSLDLVPFTGIKGLSEVVLLFNVEIYASQYDHGQEHDGRVEFEHDAKTCCKAYDTNPFRDLKAWPEVGTGPTLQCKCQVDKPICRNIEH